MSITSSTSALSSAVTGTLSSAGIGTGLDVNSIISQLMAVEQQPLNLMQQQQQGFQTQLSDYGQLKSGLSTFQSALDSLNSVSNFQVFTANSADTTTYTASADSTASLGTYQIQVQSLAAANKLGSSTFADSTTTTVGNAGDTMTMSVNGKSFSVAIGGMTLSQIRDAVNSDSSNTGVTASIVNSNSTSYNLVLTANNTGTANAVTTSFTNGGATIADPLGLSTVVAASDATLKIDNTYTVTRSSNTITDAIQGVTLNLLKTNTSNVQLDIGHDTTAITNSVQKVVDAYNALQKTMSTLQTGDLQGSTTLRLVQNQLYSVLNTAATGLSGSYHYLSEVGVTLQKDGTMSLDSTALNTALNNDFSGVASLFGDATNGYVSRMDTAVSAMVGPQGLIDNKTTSINSQISDLNSQIANEQYRLSVIQQNYTTQFSALDSLVGQMKNTSSYLTQQLG